MRKRVLIAVMLAAVLLITGCHIVFGGGWFYGRDGEKVTFGFQAQCIEDGVEGGFDAYYEGQFQYNDLANGVRFHGDINWQIGIIGDDPNTCESNSHFFGEGAAEFTGECWTQPGNVPGYFYVHVEDNGTPGPGVGDFISVETDCTPNGGVYYNEGLLGGGNIVMPGH